MKAHFLVMCVVVSAVILTLSDAHKHEQIIHKPVKGNPSKNHPEKENPKVSFSKESRRSHILFGDFGRVNTLNQTDVLHFLQTSPNVPKQFHLTGEETFVFRRAHSYKNLVTTFRYDQLLNGLPVLGGEVAVHVYPSSLQVHGISGNILSSHDVPSPSSAINLDPNVLSDLEFKRGHTAVKVVQKAVLAYIIDEADVGHLCWYIRIISRKSIGMTGKTSQSTLVEPYDVYIDALTGEILMDISVWQKGLYRQVFDVQNGKALPGVLVRKEGQAPIADANVNEAYDNAGYCYNYYWSVFGRDSWDNEGSPLNSSVHYEVNYDNAFWNGEQMVYGDGDGLIFANFTNDLSVICHELTHAVTQSTSHLRYWYESGSLNEAFSDIMGASSVVYTSDPTLDRPDPATSWILGPNVTLVNLNPTGCPDCPPGTRYMNNPPLDGSSRDYYPDRYTGLEDDRGVHWNSGIANLAYVLTVQGGVHPQEKTNIYVEPVGMTKSQQIYYLAFTQYMVATSVYVDARAATLKAASVLYPTSQPIYDSVGNAWSAVGVVDGTAILHMKN